MVWSTVAPLLATVEHNLGVRQSMEMIDWKRALIGYLFNGATAKA
jgi:hypothetical protein